MMPSKSASKTSRSSRSRSTSRSRQRSSSRTRKPSRTRRSETPSSSVSGDSEVLVEKKSKSSTKSASKATKKGEVKPTKEGSKANDLKKGATVLLDKLEVEKKSTSEEKQGDEVTTRREVITRRTVTTNVSNVAKESREEEAPTRMSTRLREKKEREGVSTFCKSQELSTYDSKAVPKTKETILFGPWGATFLTIAIPLVSICLTLMCTKHNCMPRIISLPRWKSCFDLKTLGIYVGWVVFQALLCLIPCGRLHKGLFTRNGVRLNYRCNGLFGLLITMMVLVLMMMARIRWPDKAPSITYVLDHFLALQMSAVIVAFLTGVGMYVSSRIRCRPRDLNPIGNTGCWLYDAFVGHELHPRMLSRLDVKFFTLSRLSSMSMAVLVILMCVKEYEGRGGWSQGAAMNIPLILVSVQQLLYVADTLFFEDSLLTSFAMHHEGFGLLHCFTRMVWIPFITTMPVRYLGYLGISKAPQWPSLAYAGVILLHLVSFVIRRGADSQKSDYRREPNHPAFSSLTTFPTSVASKHLLAGGWWGIVRHPNYLGELLLCVSWTIPVGLKMSTPWLCPLLLLFTIMVRIRIVEGYCARRYGNGWQNYCRKVRSRLIPFIL